MNESSHLPCSIDSAVLTSILARAPLCVIACDGEGRIVLWNGEAERVLGWPANEVLGKPAPFAIDASIVHGGPREIVRTTRAGGIAQLSITLERIPVEGGAPILLELGTDLGDRKQLERRVVQGVRIEAVAKLAGGIAHDFNNILAAINCSIGLIGDTLAPGDAIGIDVRAIMAESARAEELTRQLLAFTRQQVLAPQVVDLNAVARTAERILIGIVGNTVSLSLELADRGVHVIADAAQIEQALIHLVVNARDATPEGGRVIISTGLARLDRDPTGGEVPMMPGEYGWLQVRDTGRGIARELQGRIFEPFYTTKERGVGTGLGLSAVFGIVKQSGGYIFVESEPHQGASFTIYLSTVEASPAAAKVIHPARSNPDSPATILLVDDEDALRGLMRRILERSGYVVLEAEHGAQALERCAAHEGAIDLVVSDLVMPKMGGREMADRLRASRPNSRLLFVSGFTDDEAMHHGIITAGSAYLQKPFSPASLLAKIGEMLRGPAETP